jgi:hypothetical protein
LDPEWCVVFGRVHSINEHTSDLRSDLVISDAIADSVAHVGGQKIEQAVVDAVQIFAMLPRVIQSLPGDLWKLTATVEPGLREGIYIACVHTPVSGS